MSAALCTSVSQLLLFDLLVFLRVFLINSGRVDFSFCRPVEHLRACYA